MQVFVSQKVVRNRMCDNYSFLTYIGLRIIQQNNKDIYIVSVNQIIEELYGTIEVTKTIRKVIADRIYVLETLDLIKINKIIGKQNNKWELDLSAMKLDTSKEHYVILDVDNIQKILSIKDRGKLSVLRYYAVLLSTMIKGVGNLSLIGIREYTDIGKTTQIRCSQILEENGLIYFKRMNAYKLEEGDTLKSYSNLYGLPKDKELVDKKAASLLRHNKKNKKTIMARNNANTMRSIRQKINNNINLTAEDIWVIKEENRHIRLMTNYITDDETKKKNLKRIIDVDNCDLVTNDELVGYFNILKNNIQDVGECFVDAGKKADLMHIIRDILGPNKLASNLTIDEMDKAERVYERLLEAKNKYIKE